MKATQTRSEAPQTPSLRPCDICGTKSQPYHYTRHGKGIVCSKECSIKYANRTEVVCTSTANMVREGT